MGFQPDLTTCYLALSGRKIFLSYGSVNIFVNEHIFKFGTSFFFKTISQWPQQICSLSPEAMYTEIHIYGKKKLYKNKNTATSFLLKKHKFVTKSE